MMRSFWLLDRPLLWTPNQPHIADVGELEVFFADDFRFHVTRGSGYNSNLFDGSFTLSEFGGNEFN